MLLKIEIYFARIYVMIEIYFTNFFFSKKKKEISKIYELKQRQQPTIYLKINIRKFYSNYKRKIESFIYNFALTMAICTTTTKNLP